MQKKLIKKFHKFIKKFGKVLSMNEKHKNINIIIKLLFKEDNAQLRSFAFINRVI